MKEIVRVKEVGGRLLVTFDLPNWWEVWRLASLLASAAEDPSCAKKEAARWWVAAETLKRCYNKAASVREEAERLRVRRPPNSQSNAQDRECVVRGRPPFPVLPPVDVPVVWRRLEAQGLSALLIARRLHVKEETVLKWRAQRRALVTKGVSMAPDRKANS